MELAPRNTLNLVVLGPKPQVTGWGPTSRSIQGLPHSQATLSIKRTQMKHPELLSIPRRNSNPFKQPGSPETFGQCRCLCTVRSWHLAFFSSGHRTAFGGAHKQNCLGGCWCALPVCGQLRIFPNSSGWRLDIKYTWTQTVRSWTNPQIPKQLQVGQIYVIFMLPKHLRRLDNALC